MSDLLSRLTSIRDPEISVALFHKDDDTGWSAAIHVGREEAKEWETVRNDECEGFPHDSYDSGEWKKIDDEHHEHLVSSPMVGAAGYGMGDTPEEALDAALKEFRV